MYVLNNEVIQNDIKNRTGGIGVPKLGLYQIAQLQIPVPLLAEQETLVNKISILEAEIAANQRIIDASANEKQAIMNTYL